MGFFDIFFDSEEKERNELKLRSICRRYEKCQSSLKNLSVELFCKRKDYLNIILSIQKDISSINNLPRWCSDEINLAIEQVNDFRIAVEYENNPKKFAESTDQTGRTSVFIRSGTAADSAIATLGSSVAMSIATVLGTVSTGSAISALSGVAATNAALVWLGGGTIAAGGSAIVGGSLVLGMFGPIGIAVGTLTAVGGILFKRSKNDKRIIEIENNIDTIRHDIQIIEPKLARLSELIKRSSYNQQIRLCPAENWLKNVSPRDYTQWDDDKKHFLEKLVNAVSITSQLINERI